MAELPIFIPEIDYPLPEVTGEWVNLTIPLDWLPFFVKCLTEITEPEYHTGDYALQVANRQKIDTVLADLGPHD